MKASEVSSYVKNISDAYFLALGRQRNQSLKKIAVPSKKVFIVSPHPDDEAINGGLALRLKLELGYEVINVPFSLGSNQARQNERMIELKHACDELGFQLTHALSTSNEKNELKKLIQEHAPSIIITSHPLDGHKTHEKCGVIVLQTLEELHFQGTVVLHEYWFPQKKPNLLLEIPDEIVVTMMKALLHHQGEILRNPYHLRLPHTLIENARRGSEIILGVEKESADILFSTILTKGSIINQKFVEDTKKVLVRSSDELFLCFGN